MRALINYRDRMVESYLEMLDVEVERRDATRCDFALFTGGPDVEPVHYEAFTYHPTTRYDARRDIQDIKTFEAAVLSGIPCIGICRGAQLLNVLMGGALHQHVTSHSDTGSHRLYYNNDRYLVTSTHHQMMIPPEDKNSYTMLAVADIDVCSVDELNKEKYIEAIKEAEEDDVDEDDFPREEDYFNWVPIKEQPEIILFKEYPCLSFQPHPEYDPIGDSGKLFLRVLREHMGLDLSIKQKETR